MVRHLLEGAGDNTVSATSVTSVSFVRIVTDIVTTNALTAAECNLKHYTADIWVVKVSLNVLLSALCVHCCVHTAMLRPSRV